MIIHRALAAAMTFSTVKPSSLYIFPAGALTPKQSMPIALPFCPIYFSHPNVTPASMLILEVTSLGRTLSLYFSVCSSNNSQQTSETTRTVLPCFLSSSTAFSAISSSEPVPMRRRSGLLPDVLSEIIYPPLETASTEVPFCCGSFCHERAMIEGLFLLRTAIL